MMNSDTDFRFGFFVLLAIIAFSIYLFRLHWPDLKGVLLNDWIIYETTEGEIVETGKRLQPSGGRADTEGAVIKYIYKVDGRAYFSDQINFASDMSEYEYYLSKYPVGKRVKVFYEKGNPSFSVLEPDNQNFFRAILGPATTLLLIISYLFFWLFCHRFQWCVKLARIFDEISSLKSSNKR